MKRLFLGISLFLAGCTLWSEPGLEMLLGKSDYWPPKVRVTAISDSGDTLGTGARGVLIRIEEDPLTAVVDFGRNGIHRLAIDQTDVRVRAKAVKAGEIKKVRPNYLAMLGPPKLFRSKDGKMTAVSSAETKDWKGFLFIYIGKEESDWESLGRLLQEDKTQIQAHGLQPVLFPLYRTNDREMFKTVRDKTLPVAIMHDFLSHSFIKVLQHEPGEGPLFVATDLNGKVFAESREFTLAPLWNSLSNLNR
ncbi:MAG: hypothetical protein GVY10_06650 [Verrucomicrobia bacterium]|jgi:hypothetical protein|nr:hypothetical protein [Verrucomicrobiota bacterium]